MQNIFLLLLQYRRTGCTKFFFFSASFAMTLTRWNVKPLQNVWQGWCRVLKWKPSYATWRLIKATEIQPSFFKRFSTF